MEAKTRSEKFVPANRCLLVKRDVAEKTIMELPKQVTDVMQPNIGNVLKIADNCESGVKAGDRILFFPKAGRELILDGELFLLMNELEILGYER